MTRHSNCSHPTTAAARRRCRRDADMAPQTIRNLRIINTPNRDLEAFHALHSAVENGTDLFPHDEDLAAAEALRQFEGWLANGRTW